MAFDPLSIFTGSAYDQAAQQQRDYLSQQSAIVNANLANAQSTGLAALQSGQTNAIGAIQTGTGTAQDYINQALNPALNSLYSGQSSGEAALTSGQTSGLAALNTGVGSAVNAYNPLAATSARYTSNAAQAQASTADALGLNGPEGVARAQAQFQASPGYQYSLSQGIDAIDRSANATGQAAGGNTSRQAQTYGQNLADQDWQNYLAGLTGQQQLYAPLGAQGKAQVASGQSGAYLTGGTGSANIYTGTGGALSSLYSTTGAQAAPIYTNTGTSLANLSSNAGLSEADVYGTNAAQQANLVQGIANTGTTYAQNTNPLVTQSYGAQAAATTGGAANLWGLASGGLNFAAGAGYLPTGSNTAFGPYQPKYPT